MWAVAKGINQPVQKKKKKIQKWWATTPIVMVPVAPFAKLNWFSNSEPTY